MPKKSSTQHQRHEHQAENDPQVEPSEVAGDRSQRGVENGAQVSGRHDTPGDEGGDDAGRDDQFQVPRSCAPAPASAS